MDEADKAKRMKQQVELLKRKYLKKDNPSEPKTQDLEPSATAPTNVQPMPSPIQAKQNKSQPKQSLRPHKQQQTRPKDGWSVRNYLQEEAVAVDDSQPIAKTKKQFYEMEWSKKDPFRVGSLSLVQDRSLKAQSKADAEFEELEQWEPHLPNPKIEKVKQQKSIKIACQLWSKSHHEALHYLLFDLQELSNWDSSKQVHIVIQSTNPSFPGIVESLAMEFIFKNPNPLNEQQKNVVFDMAVNYFSPSPSMLSDVLLLCIIRIGQKCLQIYCDEILSKLGFYVQKIMLYKKVSLLEQQIDNLVSFLQDKLQKQRQQGSQIALQKYIWLLFLKPSSVYLHQIILTRAQFTQNQLLIIFCILEPVNSSKNQPLSLLYLKCVDQLMVTFYQEKILERVIENFNKIKVPESLYKPVKSLKLKMIKCGDQKGRPTEQDKGLMGFFNQKMGKLKVKLESSVGGKAMTGVQFDKQRGEYRREGGGRLGQ